MSAIVNTRFFVPDTSDFNVGVAWAGEDFSGASMVLTVTAQPSAGGATLLTADTDSARIRINDDGAGWQYFIPQPALQAVPTGLQRVSQVATQNGVSRTLFLGTWSRVAGGASANAQGPIAVDGFNLPIEFTSAPTTLALQSTGTPGDSAYEIWLAAGNRGTTADFLASLTASGANFNDAVSQLGADTVQEAVDALARRRWVAGPWTPVNPQAAGDTVDLGYGVAAGEDLEVYLDGRRQFEGDDFELVGSLLTFTGAGFDATNKIRHRKWSIKDPEIT